MKQLLKKWPILPDVKGVKEIDLSKQNINIIYMTN